MYFKTIVAMAVSAVLMAGNALAAPQTNTPSESLEVASEKEDSFSANPFAQSFALQYGAPDF